MRMSTPSKPIDNEICHAKLIEVFIAQTSPDTYYLPRYLIPQFQLKRIMVNVLLNWCCAVRINLCHNWAAGSL